MSDPRGTNTYTHHSRHRLSSRQSRNTLFFSLPYALSFVVLPAVPLALRTRTHAPHCPHTNCFSHLRSLWHFKTLAHNGGFTFCFILPKGYEPHSSHFHLQHRDFHGSDLHPGPNRQHHYQQSRRLWEHSSTVSLKRLRSKGERPCCSHKSEPHSPKCVGLPGLFLVRFIPSQIIEKGSSQCTSFSLCRVFRMPHPCGRFVHADAPLSNSADKYSVLTTKCPRGAPTKRPRQPSVRTNRASAPSDVRANQASARTERAYEPSVRTN